MAEQPENFNFEISLSVLNHLGRNLYRNFITVLGEAVSNSWDADANNVWIYINKDESSFVIKDDGDGMDASDFRDKFLTVGYSKRGEGQIKSVGERPYIGAKGIGKLALLSCADIVSIISKKTDTDYIGGVIDNSGLDHAIQDQLKPSQYPLGQVDLTLFEAYTKGHQKGTIIHFEHTKESIKNTVPYLRKLIALYFRFSLIDPGFTIHVNDVPVTFDDIRDLAESTQFVWVINELDDTYVSTQLTHLRKLPVGVINNPSFNASGFIASVEKPRSLKIAGTEEKAGIDLFVNGRLREKDILKHLPDFSTRFVASYLYGQIHFDALDTGTTTDKAFTSSREGIVSDNEDYAELLRVLKDEILGQISNEWDAWRLEIDETGDEENPQKSKKARFARGLFKESATDYSGTGNDNVDTWIKDLRGDAEFNVPAYVDCFLSENLIRRYIHEVGIPLSTRATNDIATYRQIEQTRKGAANINFDISTSGDLAYLDMDTLSDVVDGPPKQNAPSLSRDAIDYKPVRNAVGHTALLTDPAKTKLSTVYQNIVHRIRNLLSGNV